MAAILTAAEMRAAETRAMDSGQVTGPELMERAGSGVVEAVLEHWPALATRRSHATVLCGPGNNGGDGFVVARLLALRGWRVRVLFSGDPLRLSPDARGMHDRWGALGPVEPLNEPTLRAGEASDLYVDAIFGLGLARPPEGDLRDVITHLGGRNGDLGHYRPRTVAVDAPSGLDLDSGRVLGASSVGTGMTLQASLTVTFQALKPGHLLGHGPGLCGRVVVADIGIGPWLRMEHPRLRDGHWSGIARPARQGSVEPPRPIHRYDPLAWPWTMLDKAAQQGAHKYAHGHALLLAGGCGRGGAARLAARGALRIGAGLVTLAVPPAALQENAARLDAVMLRPVRDAEALSALLADPRLNALCAGPGLGTSDREAALLHALLDASRGAGEGAPAAAPGQGRGADPRPRPLVLDADALTLLARDPSLRAKLHPACVLTPHEGEFARLFPAIARRLSAPATTGPAYSKLDAARDAARDAGCVILLKGPDTVIAEPPPQPRPGSTPPKSLEPSEPPGARPATAEERPPDAAPRPAPPPGRAAINAAAYDRAAPWLATAGSGDVLAGMIAGLLARGFPPHEAACTAAWLHVECARSFGPGLVAEDLPEELPKVFRALGL